MLQIWLFFHSPYQPSRVYVKHVATVVVEFEHDDVISGAFFCGFLAFYKMQRHHLIIVIEGSKGHTSCLKKYSTKFSIFPNRACLLPLMGIFSHTKRAQNPSSSMYPKYRPSYLSPTGTNNGMQLVPISNDYVIWRVYHFV